MKGRAGMTSRERAGSLAFGFAAALLATSAWPATLGEVDFVRWEVADPDVSYESEAMREDGLIVSDVNNFGVVQTRREIGVHFAANGNIRETLLWSNQFLDSAGVRNFGNSEISVNRTDTVATIRRAAVLLPDGSALKVDPTTVQIVTSESGDVFSDYYDIVDVHW